MVKKLMLNKTVTQVTDMQGCRLLTLNSRNHMNMFVRSTGLMHVNVTGHKLVEVISSARKTEACFCCEPALVVLFR